MLDEKLAQCDNGCATTLFSHVEGMRVRPKYGCGGRCAALDPKISWITSLKKHWPGDALMRQMGLILRLNVTVSDNLGITQSELIKVFALRSIGKLWFPTYVNWGKWCDWWLLKLIGWKLPVCGIHACLPAFLTRRDFKGHDFSIVINFNHWPPVHQKTY